MPIRVEAYTAGGVVTGVVPHSGTIRDALEGSPNLPIDASSWLPLDGSGEHAGGDLVLAVDDLLFVVGDPGSAPVHAQWHDIELDAGPYRLHGEMPTMPGFDPGRALARPTGEFVLLRDARIQLIGQPEAGEATAVEVLVNRYTVDRIQADLMLGFFFPGAAIVVLGHDGEPIQPTGAVPAGDGAAPATGASI
ncbi:MAG TPA: hypothetical protein VFO73_09970 [Candidatus Limnocylindrales bacterium]|nr:hypothetical protein [Candidatus Limnocylindrales bacterium]